MRFDELDHRMRVFETAHDVCVLPGIHIVARIDGRGFTRLTKDVHKFEAPYDPRFRDMMVHTVQHLMQCGFNVVYGYTQSDEISLLFHLDEDAFNRKERKWNSLLAGEASACFSLLLGGMAAFDSRICQLPTPALVADYFAWRNEDAARNALNAHCYWTLRKTGLAPDVAATRLARLAVAEKNELLFQHGVNFNDLPLWQKRGIGFYWHMCEKQGFNPKTGVATKTMRRQLKVDMELPMREQYREFIAERLM
ncbi:tRNA(His) guanylyltransferase Thg1 family protein [Chitinimonas sp. JJ19]|uniref:tRNA(His) guanylyltransferase Thg1 family protein n=1 Tax=Chitinimonas sp. JJ19 TaxID=3109352 RepID=UPI0030011C9F